MPIKIMENQLFLSLMTSITIGLQIEQEITSILLLAHTRGQNEKMDNDLFS